MQFIAHKNMVQLHMHLSSTIYLAPSSLDLQYMTTPSVSLSRQQSVIPCWAMSVTLILTVQKVPFTLLMEQVYLMGE